MRRFNLNVAYAFIGHRVNLHLKDGSVLVNVYLADAKREKDNGKPAVHYFVQQRLHKKSQLRIFLKEVEWIEPLNPHLSA